MARKTKVKEAPVEEKSNAKEEPKYGVDDLCEATGLQPASVRVALRELGVEKNFGNRYGWDTKKDFDEVVKGMKERSAKRVAAPKEEEPEEKPKAKRTARGKKKASAE